MGCSSRNYLAKVTLQQVLVGVRVGTVGCNEMKRVTVVKRILGRRKQLLSTSFQHGVLVVAKHSVNTGS